jgi:hypothetical protein
VSINSGTAVTRSSTSRALKLTSGAVPQTTLVPVVTRRYSSGLLNFTSHSPEDSQRDRRCRSARHHGPYRRDCSSTERRVGARSLCLPHHSASSCRQARPRNRPAPWSGGTGQLEASVGRWSRFCRGVPSPRHGCIVTELALGMRHVRTFAWRGAGFRKDRAIMGYH